MKYLFKLILFLLLLALPFVGRWYYFYPSRYAAPTIAEVNVEGIEPYQFVYQPIDDDPVAGDGDVLFDVAHNNNLTLDDLTPLQDRLALRGASFENFEGDASALAARLRRASAYVVLTPSSSFSREEREAVEDFVADGGRLLLVADPTHPVLLPPELDPSGGLSGLLSISAVPAINSLAGMFGVFFFDDYLYNLSDNEGNYRNVRLTPVDQGAELTAGIESIAFLAGHSLRGKGQPLIAGDVETLSSLRSGETELTAAMTAAEGNVLAVGDVTFLTAPYHTIADNDRFVSNIADWLAVDSRVRDLSDYPYLFDGPVDLIQVSDGYLDARLIARSGALQADFERADLSLSLQAEPNPEHDTLFVGTFSKLERVQDYLTQAGITVTLVMTDDMVEADSEALTEPESEAEATATPAAEGEEAAPPEEAAEEPAEVTIEEIPDESELAEESDETQPQSQIEVFGLGKIGLEGTSLFVVDETADHLVVIALAEDGTAAIGALEQLAKGDFSSCVMGQSVTVCSTGEVQNGQGLDLSRQAEAEDASAQKRIFLLSDDDGANGSRTSALDMALLLGDDYEVTVWSTSADGPPSPEAAEGYDLYVIDSGDYAFEQADFDNFFALAGILQNVVVIGQQPFMSVDQTFAPINDVTVVATDHPLAQGLPAEIIPLAPVESGNAALVISADDNAFQDGEVVLARGPNSDEADSAATIAVGDEDGSHFVVIPFAFYRLPEEVQETFLTNIIDWVFAE